MNTLKRINNNFKNIPMINIFKQNLKSVLKQIDFKQFIKIILEMLNNQFQNL